MRSFISRVSVIRGETGKKGILERAYRMMWKNSAAHASIPASKKIAKIVPTTKRCAHIAMIFTSRRVH